jgi:ABC-type amino acid transport system permease subunit
MQAIIEIISRTPWWVWILFVFLLWIGLRALRPSTGPFWRLAILPLVFLVWGLQSLVSRYPIDAFSLGPWLLAIAIGVALGLLLVARVELRADRAHGLIWLPGGATTLVLILLIFAARYTFGVLQGMTPGIIADPRFLIADVGLSGLVAGIFAGRLLGLWRKYRAAPDENLAS